MNSSSKRRTRTNSQRYEVRGTDLGRGVDNLQDSRLPVCVFSDGIRMECPTVRQITEKLGWFRDPCLSQYDLAHLWGGPGGT